MQLFLCYKNYILKELFKNKFKKIFLNEQLILQIIIRLNKIIQSIYP